MEAVDDRYSFVYKARDPSGKLVRGRMEASAPEEVETQLDSQGFFPISIQVEKSAGREREGEGLIERIRPVKKQELIIFTRQMATLLDAGLPILRGLKLATEQVHSQKLKRSLEDVAQRVEQGAALSDALSCHPKIFPSILIGMVRSGETSGQLQEIMENLSNLLEFELATEQRIKAATRYPKLVMGSLGIAFGILVTSVVPKFMSMFASRGMDLPLPTRILIQINNLVQNHGLLILIGTTVSVFFFRRFINQPNGRYLWDRFRLRLPIMGKLFLLIAMSRFSRVLSLMVSSGVPILTAFDMVAETVGNSVVAREIGRIREAVEGGSGISGPMKSGTLFPGLVAQMVSIGEESGKMDTMLGKVANYYEDESDYLIKNLSSNLEPIILLFLGGMVAFLALAIFLPMWSVMDLAKGGMG